jgi:hypothetical protein
MADLYIIENTTLPSYLKVHTYIHTRTYPAGGVHLLHVLVPQHHTVPVGFRSAAGADTLICSQFGSRGGRRESVDIVQRVGQWCDVCKARGHVRQREVVGNGAAVTVAFCHHVCAKVVLVGTGALYCTHWSGSPSQGPYPPPSPRGMTKEGFRERQSWLPWV